MKDRDGINGETPSCGHGRRDGCIYCPECGERYRVARGGSNSTNWFTAAIEWIARIYTPLSATPDLDVACNLEAIRSGDAERTRAALGYLMDLAAQAREIRSTIEGLLNHEDRDIALRARDLIAAMDAV
tara:strand:- start:145 stop:531 length:387 start_codon:yes stop_codon:yes gene_type:complete